MGKITELGMSVCSWETRIILVGTRRRQKKKGWKKAKYGCHIRDQSCLLQSDFVVTAAGPPLPHTFRVKTTPQMTRFRDCKNLVTDEIDDHRIQSDYKCTIGLQNPEGKNSTFGIAYAW